MLLSYPEIHEIQNAKQLSFYDAYGVVVMLRQKTDEVVLAFGKGAQLQEKFSSLEGKAKIVRYLRFKKDGEIDKEQIKAMIEEAMVLNLEYSQMRKLKAGL